MSQECKESHYEVLMVAPNAHITVIKAAYRALALQYHPDKNAGAINQIKMSAINDAWGVLSDNNKRAEYDLWIKDQEMIDDWKQSVQQSKLNEVAVKASTESSHTYVDGASSTRSGDGYIHHLLGKVKKLNIYFFSQATVIFLALLIVSLFVVQALRYTDPLNALAIESSKGNSKDSPFILKNTYAADELRGPALKVDYGDKLVKK